jgi:DNA-binding LacI/PurR family transcriptional regulator
MSPVSIKDIAQAAGVSHSTVSRALSDSPLVKAETKARIQRLAHEMGYSPDARARSLVMGQTRTVGVVVTSIADPFIASVVQAIESAAHDQGYAVILCSSNSAPEREIAAVEMLQSKRVDGVIVASSRIGALYQEHLERLSVPIVLINSHSKYSEHYTYAVSVDNRQGGYLATAHLAQLGHRRIAYVARPSDHSSNLERQEGYRQALTGAGLPYAPSLVTPCSGRVESGAQVLPQLLALPEPPSAVFCYNDLTAIGLLHAAREAGLTLPGDLAVVGFDDIPLASYVCPPLTTVAQPHGEMGRQAVQMTLALKQARDEQFSNIVLAGQLIIRESSGVGSRE